MLVRRQERHQKSTTAVLKGVCLVDLVVLRNRPDDKADRDVLPFLFLTWTLVQINN